MEIENKTPDRFSKYGKLAEAAGKQIDSLNLYNLNNEPVNKLAFLPPNSAVSGLMAKDITPEKWGEIRAYENAITRSWSQSDWLDAVKENGKVLITMPQEQRTPSLNREAVRHDGNNIQYLNFSERMLDVRMAATSQDGTAIAHLSPVHQTPEVRLNALKQNPLAADKIHDRILSDKELSAAIKAHPDFLGKLDKFDAERATNYREPIAVNVGKLESAMPAGMIENNSPKAGAGLWALLKNIQGAAVNLADTFKEKMDSLIPGGGSTATAESAPISEYIRDSSHSPAYGNREPANLAQSDPVVQVRAPMDDQKQMAAVKLCSALSEFGVGVTVEQSKAILSAALANEASQVRIGLLAAKMSDGSNLNLQLSPKAANTLVNEGGLSPHIGYMETPGHVKKPSMLTLTDIREQENVNGLENIRGEVKSREYAPDPAKARDPQVSEGAAKPSSYARGEM